jgi:hypothetical protein
MLPPQFDGVEVEMNNGLYRQIKANQRSYWAWQERLGNWYDEVLHGERKRISNR